MDDKWLLVQMRIQFIWLSQMCVHRSVVIFTLDCYRILNKYRHRQTLCLYLRYFSFCIAIWSLFRLWFIDSGWSFLTKHYYYTYIERCHHHFDLHDWIWKSMQKWLTSWVWRRCISDEVFVYVMILWHCLCLLLDDSTRACTKGGNCPPESRFSRFLVFFENVLEF